MLLPGPPGGALNTLYYCTKFVPEVANIAPSKGGDAGRFFVLASGGMYLRKNTALPPPKWVMLANFFRPPGACARVTAASLPSKGEGAVRFSAPPPREVQGKKILLAPGLCFLASLPM